MTRYTAIAFILTLLSGCSTVTYKDRPVSPLVVASCPPTLGVLRDTSFGATTLKLDEVVAQYWECFTAVCGADGANCRSTNVVESPSARR